MVHVDTVSMILKPEFGGKIRGHSLAKYDPKFWKGLQLTTEEMLYVKYMYHDLQMHNLTDFVQELKKKRPALIPFVHLCDTEKRHLTPYILIFDPNVIIANVWLIRYEVDEFNMSYLSVNGSGRSVKTKYQSAGHVRWTAAEAVDNFLFNLKMYPLNSSQQALPTSKKPLLLPPPTNALPAPDNVPALSSQKRILPAPPAGALPAPDAVPVSSQKRLPAPDGGQFEKSLSAFERKLRTVTDWIEKRKTDKIVDIDSENFKLLVNQLDDYMKRIQRLEQITGSGDQLHGMSYDPFSMMVKKAPSSSART